MKFDLKSEVFISREELIYFFRRNQIRALVVFLAVFLTALLYLGKSPHPYIAKAQFSFTDQNISDLASKIEILASSSSHSDGKLSLLTSQQLLQEVIEETGLQIVHTPQNKLLHSISSFFRHLKIEAGVLPKPQEGFVFSHVKMKENQKIRKMSFRFQNLEEFEVLDAGKNFLGTGKIKEPFHLEEGEFTLEKIPDKIRVGKSYFFTILPPEKLFKGVKKALSIKPDRNDSSTYHVLFSALDPNSAKRVLNTFFSKYELHKRRLHLDVLSKDIEEIQNQERTLRKELFTRLENRAKEYSNQIGEGQFIDAQSEIEILHSSKKACLERLLELEILLARLEEKNSGIGIKAVDLGSNIRTLGEQLESIQQIQNSLSSDPGSWKELYTYANQKLGYATPQKLFHAEETSRLFASQIVQHLKSKKELFETTSKALTQEVQGKIDLTLGQSLLSDHYRKVFELESLIQQLVFLKGELLRPDFEISSMSSLLSDPFLQSLLKGTAELSLQLHDLVNHTSREQDRIRESIVFTKQFLDHHLRQKVDLLQLELQLTRLRAERIQNGMLEQIRNEKDLLEKRVHLVQQEVAELPNKWLLENYFEVESELTKNLLKAFVGVEQSKILEKMTFHSNFQILDPVFALSEPLKKHTFVLAALGAIFLTIIYLSFALTMAAQKGFPISLQFLKTNRLEILPFDPQAQALWLSNRYGKSPLAVALFSDLTNSGKVLQALNEMGFKTTLWKVESAYIGKKDFPQKIEEMRQNFDFILLVGDDLLSNVEKSALLKYCDLSFVVCRNQSTADFYSLFDWAEQKGVNHVAFSFEVS